MEVEQGRVEGIRKRRNVGLTPTIIPAQLLSLREESTSMAADIAGALRFPSYESNVATSLGQFVQYRENSIIKYICTTDDDTGPISTIHHTRLGIC